LRRTVGDGTPRRKSEHGRGMRSSRPLNIGYPKGCDPHVQPTHSTLTNRPPGLQPRAKGLTRMPPTDWSQVEKVGRRRAKRWHRRSGRGGASWVKELIDSAQCRRRCQLRSEVGWSPCSCGESSRCPPPSPSTRGSRARKLRTMPELLRKATVRTWRQLGQDY
jgi:hypothetical protein